ncbi:MAG: hypothetical protein R6U93_06225 [Dehalococcoidia bacterium]
MNRTPLPAGAEGSPAEVARLLESPACWSPYGEQVRRAGTAGRLNVKTIIGPINRATTFLPFEL